MRFRSRSPAPNYLGRREQRRLLTILCLSALILLLMREAGKPGNWNWFVALNDPTVLTPAGAEIDTRLQPAPRGEDVPGAFTSPLETPAAAAHSAEFFAGVNAELLDSVRDDTVFRGAEHDAFFHLLEILHNTDQKTLDAASRGPTAFVQLYQQPDEYRGKLVSVRGTVRGVFEIPASRNDYGIRRYYQTWIQPYDNPELPLVLYVLELPPKFPVAERMHEEVEITGFFFKRWAYRAQDAIRSAPLLLAKTVRWKQPLVAETQPVDVKLIVGIVALALIGAGGVVWMASRSGAALACGRPSPRGRGRSPAPTAASTAEYLMRLAEQVVEPVASSAAHPGPADEDSRDEQRPVT